MRLPRALTQHQDGATPYCTVTVICPIRSGPWKGWAAGSVSSPDQHLVITASPKSLHNYAKVVNGPAWYPQARVRPLVWLPVNGWRICLVFVPADTNDGSAFAHHVVLIWTVGKHTYAAGFHEFGGMRATLQLDRQLAASIKLVHP
jgi:hypothetical protein